ncbi:MAG: hypothetical protein J4452_02015 [Candidatus Aenigmarchaeota archaeon]|nr:hypothetical protein [Candidatus Aenigmarchaeota archaeon]
MAVSSQKTFIQPEDFMRGSVALARLVSDSQFFYSGPDGHELNYLVGVWRGGTHAAIYVDETLKQLGYKMYHTSVKIESYPPGQQQRGQTRDIGGLNHPVEKMIMSQISRANQGLPIISQRLVFVDDVWDTGLSGIELMSRSMSMYQKKMRQVLDALPILREIDNFGVLPEIKMATVYYKPERNRTKRIPDFYVMPTNEWLVFPHELKELTRKEIRKNKDPVFAAALYERNFRKWARRHLKLPAAEGKSVFDSN